MIKPEEILTRDKERDAKICNLFMEESKTLEEIGLEFDMTAPSVHYILQKNKSLLQLDREFEKIKRVNVLKRLLKNAPDGLAKNKDKTDVISELRKELEGDSKLIVNNSVSNIRLSEIDTEGLRAIIALGRERINSERTA